VRYAFIYDYREEFNIRLMCKAVEVSRSGYYNWLTKPVSPRKQKKYELQRLIEDIFEGSRKTYGSPRVYQVLKGLGHKTSEGTVARYMQEMGLTSKSKKKYRIVTTNSNHQLQIPQNLLKQDFSVKSPGEVLLGDITYVKTNEGWLYLSAVLDLGSREVIGWNMSDSLERQGTIDALKMAIKRTNITDNTIFHSDRGIQYACNDFKKELKANGIAQSMSARGNCYDNAPMESFFHSLKVEFIHHERFATREEAKLRIFEWIEVFYNRERLHSSLGYKSPLDYKNKILDKAA